MRRGGVGGRVGRQGARREWGEGDVAEGGRREEEGGGEEEGM